MRRSNKISFSVRRSRDITVPLVANMHSHAHCQPFEINANTETVAGRLTISFLRYLVTQRPHCGCLMITMIICITADSSDSDSGNESERDGCDSSQSEAEND
ncbi:unnamed protein product [Danaus chrysippus]|uniref:(African queen) hypothetical protein n=1 Tax=Danaus chrysippus TaxID=151541 RepID=A0A8J2WB77_9NEOP|nr:unnamed protein product [Danaus chrysippus]